MSMEEEKGMYFAAGSRLMEYPDRFCVDVVCLLLVVVLVVFCIDGDGMLQ